MKAGVKALTALNWMLSEGSGNLHNRQASRGT